MIIKLNTTKVTPSYGELKTTISFEDNDYGYVQWYNSKIIFVLYPTNDNDNILFNLSDFLNSLYMAINDIKSNIEYFEDDNYIVQNPLVSNKFKSSKNNDLVNISVENLDVFLLDLKQDLIKFLLWNEVSSRSILLSAEDLYNFLKVGIF